MKAIRVAIILVGLIAVHSCATKKTASDGSIYKNDENRNEIYRIYEQRMAEWPVPFEEINIVTRYGLTNIIGSGNPLNPAIFLLHPMGVTATVWQFNIEQLSEQYRVYCINTIGDIGKSELHNMDVYPKNGKDYAAWFEDILDTLNLESCHLVGGSMGGWISLNCAAYLPERIDHLVLLGPMGIKANTWGVMSRLTKIIINPSEKNKKRLTSWTLGENEFCNRYFGEYLNIAMNCKGRMAIPKRLSGKDLNKLQSKTMLILGEFDNPIGNPHKNKNFANKYIKDVTVRIVNTGHLMNVEQPEIINNLILEFLNPPLSN